MCSTPPRSRGRTRPSRSRRRGGGRGERARAHPVDGEAGDGVGEAGEEADVAAERQPLVADLRGRGDDDVADPLGRYLRVPPQQLADDLDGHVVGAGLPEEPAGPALPNAVRTPSTNTTSLQLARHERSIARLTDRSIRRAGRGRCGCTVAAWTGRRSAHGRRSSTSAGSRHAAAEGERDDLRLAGIAGASWAGGLSALMLGDEEGAAALLRRAADEYRTSWDAAPGASWGRPIAMLRCRLIAGDTSGARADADAALAAGALEADGPDRRLLRGTGPSRSRPGRGGGSTRRADRGRRARPRGGRARSRRPGAQRPPRRTRTSADASSRSFDVARGLSRGRRGRGHRPRPGRARRRRVGSSVEPLSSPLLPGAA